MERFNEIDIVKGIAMLTVLWHHSFILYPIYMLDIPWCQHAMDINGTFFMNVFFLVSGYLFAFSKKRSYVNSLKGKLKRLLVPYLSFSAATLGMKIIAPSLVNRKVESIGSYIDKLLLGGGIMVRLCTALDFCYVAMDTTTYESTVCMVYRCRLTCGRRSHSRRFHERHLFI